MPKLTGYAAQTTDAYGETHDLGAGWATESGCRSELADAGMDVESVEIYFASSYDGWTSWEPVE